MFYIRLAVLAASAALLAPSPSTLLAQEIIMQKAMSLQMAQSIAQGAVEKCRADGYHVSVSVIDGSGLLKAFARDDGAGPGSIDVSRRKAYTALIFRRTSAETASAWATTSPVPNVEGTVALGGAVPIKSGNEFVGAVGVSGAPSGDKDEACAGAGIAKVADKLK
jgi:uncharacterized protein GlcG (DUF336 family)